VSNPQLEEFKNGYKILDHGYLKYITHMGTDESFVEAARMSTGKGFFGWVWEEDTFADCWCTNCEAQHLQETLPATEDGLLICTNCWTENIGQFDVEECAPEPKQLGHKGAPRDLGLLTTLYANRHQTPFEMGEICIEVKAPIFVFREWHRHRTQSYNEFSARYSQMPNEHYLPDASRLTPKMSKNKQESSTKMSLGDVNPQSQLKNLKDEQQEIFAHYETLLEQGVPKEVARVNTPVSRYSKMRAKTDVRNWLAFLALRMEMGAQWEIRQYANAMGKLIRTLYPRTFELFLEYDLLGTRFSRTEMKVIRGLVAALTSQSGSSYVTDAFFKEAGLSNIVGIALLKKIALDKEEIYKDSI